MWRVHAWACWREAGDTRRQPVLREEALPVALAQAQSHVPGADLMARLDAVPISGFHKRLLAVSGFGWMFDSMDVGIISFVVATLAREWKLIPDQVAWLISIGTLGMLVGAALAGTLADRFGRKTMFQMTLLIFSIATAFCGVAWSYIVLAFGRFLVGFGLGGELPIASTLVSEFSPARWRGRMLVLLESFWAFGWVVAALIAFFIIPQYGWRIAFLLGAIPAFYVFVLRRSLPESPRFLLSKGRTAEAEEVIRRVEKASGVSSPKGSGQAATAVEVAPPAESASQRFAELWSRPYLRRTVMLWVLWFTIVYSYYGIFTWLPTLLSETGRSLTGSFLYVLIITLAQIPGYFSAAYLVDKVGRKWTLAPYLFFTAVGAFFFRNAGTQETILFWGCFMSFFNLGAWGVVYTYTPEMYPTRARGTGAGSAAAFGRLGGVLAPLVVGQMLGKWGVGYESIFLMFAAVLLVGAINVALLGEETKGKRLEEIAG
jgi:MFS transporter, putative metabolite:H+ symporter